MASGNKEDGKKKLSLVNLNSKLNSMLSAKKLNMSAVSGEIEKEKREEMRKTVEIQYDPQQPSNYEMIKQNYLSLFSSLAEDPYPDDGDEPQPMEAE